MMIKGMTGRIFVVVGIIGVITTVSAIIYIQWAHIRAKGYMQHDIMVVTPVINNTSAMFSRARVEETADNFDGRIETIELSGIFMQNPGNGNTAFAHTIITGQNYFNMTHTEFAGGEPWQHNKGNDIVLCTSLAWRLFGSIDVVGLAVDIGNTRYTVSGITETESGIQAPGQFHGFAWMPSDINNPGQASILLLQPRNYNRLNSHLDTVRFITDLGLHSQNYIITDINVYIESINIRGKVLLGFAGFCFVAAATWYIWKMIKNERRTGRMQFKIEWVWIAGLVIANAAVIALLIPNITMDLWTPDFMNLGWGRYIQLVFNNGLLENPQHLPSHFVALHGWNQRASVAFWVGMVGIAGVVLRRFGKSSTTAT
ncbi:MAG: ABC transporter permease [Defluviitaleaceae bacterium]|nr:ABC transporter permease [Defluviitaleaceae bacterium]